MQGLRLGKMAVKEECVLPLPYVCKKQAEQQSNFVRVGMKQFAKKFYKSKAWQDCRAAFITSKFGICEQCGAGGAIVHHKTRLTPQNINDPNVSLRWDNLELLCLLCHNKTHGSGSTSDDTRFDEAGNLIPKTPPRSISSKKRPGTGQGRLKDPGSPQSNQEEMTAR